MGGCGWVPGWEVKALNCLWWGSESHNISSISSSSDFNLGKGFAWMTLWVIQLAQIYGHGQSKLKVKIPYVQQQNNGHDYGLFAIINKTEFATNKYSGLKEGKLGFTFIQSEMREHWIKCFHQNYMEPFPKEKMQELRSIKVSSIDIDLFCRCSVPDVSGLGPWITCDTCDQCYPQKCEGINGKKYQKTSCIFVKKMPKLSSYIQTTISWT